MGLISGIEINLSTCNEEYSSEETNSDTGFYDNSSDLVNYLLDMAEISQHWSLPITISVEFDSQALCKCVFYSKTILVGHVMTETTDNFAPRNK